MRYLGSTKVNHISVAGDDKFIVAIFRDDKKRERAFMDSLGRISDKGYYNLEKRNRDDFFEAEYDAESRQKVLISPEGEEIFVFGSRDEVHSFSDGFAVFEPDKAGRNYWVSDKGEIFGQEFKTVYDFSYGRGVAQLLNGNFVFVNTKFDIVSPEFEHIVPFFNENYTTAVVHGKTVVIDKNYNVVSDGFVDENGIKQDYKTIYYIDKNNIIYHYDSDKKLKFSLIGIDGKKLGTDHWSIAGFVDGICRVQDPDGTGYVNLSGNYITNQKFINASDFKEGFAVVGGFDENREFIFAFLKPDGTLLDFDSSYFKSHPEKSKNWIEFTSDFSEGLGTVIVKGTKRYAVDKTGKILKGASWLGEFHSGLATYETKSKKKSYLNTKFESFSKEFDSASRFYGRFAVVANGDDYDVILQNETMLSEISKFAEQIEINPRNIIMLPDYFFFDEKLIANLFELSLDVATKTDDQEYLQISKRISERLKERVQEQANLNKLRGKNG